MISLLMPVTISLVMAIVAGAVVWLVWSVIENVLAKRGKKEHHAAPPAEPAESTETADQH
ncbi:MAG: hypothetical protein IT367_12455 [Candidatus Hydrogenedentes bacterium]|nr:hypothetical protein [Candidatus Hydrogenedentota bacterium]